MCLNILKSQEILLSVCQNSVFCKYSSENPKKANLNYIFKCETFNFFLDSQHWIWYTKSINDVFIESLCKSLLFALCSASKHLKWLYICNWQILSISWLTMGFFLERCSNGFCYYLVHILCGYLSIIFNRAVFIFTKKYFQASIFCL